jgi:hypothetical protein
MAAVAYHRPLPDTYFSWSKQMTQIDSFHKMLDSAGVHRVEVFQNDMFYVFTDGDLVFLFKSNQEFFAWGAVVAAAPYVPAKRPDMTSGKWSALSDEFNAKFNAWVASK